MLGNDVVILEKGDLIALLNLIVNLFRRYYGLIDQDDFDLFKRLASEVNSPDPIEGKYMDLFISQRYLEELKTGLETNKTFPYVYQRPKEKH